MEQSGSWYMRRAGIFFLLMTLFAILFAAERFQADGAHYLLHVVQSENFRIEHQRFILAFSQVLPLAGVKIGLPLGLIIHLNSLNNVLWFFLLFLYAVKYLRDKHAGVAIILSMVLGILHIQFIPMYEIWYGIPLVIIVHAHWNNGRYHRAQDIIFISLILATAVFSHPLLPIPVIFSLLWHYSEIRKREWTPAILVVVSIGVWYLIKKLYLTDYESGKMSLLTGNDAESWRKLLSLGYLKGLLVFFLTWYTIPSVIFIWTLIYLISVRPIFQVMLYAGSVLGHIVLINSTHTNDDQLTPYFERMYLPLIPLVMIPFIFHVQKQMRMEPRFAFFFLLLVCGWRIGRFTDEGLKYEQRTEDVQKVIQLASQSEGSKFILNNRDFYSCYSWADWSFPMETILRSTVNGRTLTIATEEDMKENNNAGTLRQNQFMFRRWEIMKDTELNPDYFALKGGPYQVLPAICP